MPEVQTGFFSECPKYKQDSFLNALSTESVVFRGACGKHLSCRFGFHSRRKGRAGRQGRAAGQGRAEGQGSGQKAGHGTLSKKSRSAVVSILDLVCNTPLAARVQIPAGLLLACLFSEDWGQRTRDNGQGTGDRGALHFLSPPFHFLNLSFLAGYGSGLLPTATAVTCHHTCPPTFPPSASRSRLGEDLAENVARHPGGPLRLRAVHPGRPGPREPAVHRGPQGPAAHQRSRESSVPPCLAALPAARRPPQRKGVPTSSRRDRRPSTALST